MLLRIGIIIVAVARHSVSSQKSYFVTTETCTWATLVDAMCHFEVFHVIVHNIDRLKQTSVFW